MHTALCSRPRDDRSAPFRVIRSGLRSAIVALTLILLAPSIARAQITVETITRTLGDGTTARGFIAFINLTDPKLEIISTSPLPAGTGYEATLTRTDTWATSVNANLAINANFFSVLSGGTTADIIGASVSGNRVASPIRTFGTNGPDPALSISIDRVATVGPISQTTANASLVTVAGVGPSTTDSDPGTLLVTDGINTGATARVDPLNRNPRTAVATNQAGTLLIVVVIDGRQPAWSVGMTLPELASYMIERGAWRAVNLDGGGSSSFWYKPGSAAATVNRPSDGSFRAVANHLGFKINTDSYRTTRQVRAAWLRPPGTLSALETNLAQLRNARVTDLYLETLYWGVATNDSDVFSDRFTYDYLEQAIPLAAKYGIRMHAWLEAAYLQYQNFGSDNFTLDPANPQNGNPEWRAINVATGQPGGDGTAGQVFGNLAHPGLQAKLRRYTKELAAYPGLWGIQTDYHRYPLDNNTGDNFPSPWSYDSYSQQAFDATIPASVNITTQAARTNHTYYNSFLQWRKDGISEAANQMNLGINEVDPSVEFSAAMFAVPETAKCQDWAKWAQQGYVDWLVPMAYGSTTSSIINDMNIVKAASSGRRVVAGLAIINPTVRPSISAQLLAIKSAAIEDFALFEATILADAFKQGEVKNFTLTSSTKQRGDFNSDGYVDARDWDRFRDIYTGTQISAGGGRFRFDYNGDNVINETDWSAFKAEFSRFRFGENGVVDQKDIDALIACLGTTVAIPANEPLPLFDLDGDFDVDYDDQLRLHTLLNGSFTPDADVNEDGTIDIEDLYEQYATPIDINRDGLIDTADGAALEGLLRSNEYQDMNNGRR